MALKRAPPTVDGITTDNQSIYQAVCIFLSSGVINGFIQ